MIKPNLQDLKLTKRPHIPATKKLDLTGLTGRQIVKRETRKVLTTHAETFKRLADM